MIIGIHPNYKVDKFGYDSQRIIDILRYNKIQTEILFAGDISFWDQVRDCGLFIFQWTHHDYYRQIAHSILPIIHNELKIRCFPKPLSSWLYDDKIREYYLLKIHGFPIVPSWIFYDIENAFNFLEQADYPLVFKLKSGAGSKMVRLLKTKSEAIKFVRLMFGSGVSYRAGLPGAFADEIKREGFINSIRIKLGRFKNKIINNGPTYDQDWINHRGYIFFQKFLPNNPYDTRVVIIGSKAFAFQRSNLKNDFRASGSDIKNFEAKNIDLNFIDTAFRISKDFGFDCMSFDFLYTEDRQPAITEMSYVFGSIQGSKMSDCPGYWDEKLNWHAEKAETAFWILSELIPDRGLEKTVPHGGSSLKRSEIPSS